MMEATSEPVAIPLRESEEDVFEDVEIAETPPKEWPKPLPVPKADTRTRAAPLLFRGADDQFCASPTAQHFFHDADDDEDEDDEEDDDDGDGDGPSVPRSRRDDEETKVEAAGGWSRSPSERGSRAFATPPPAEKGRLPRSSLALEEDEGAAADFDWGDDDAPAPSSPLQSGRRASDPGLLGRRRRSWLSGAQDEDEGASRRASLPLVPGGFSPEPIYVSEAFV